MSKYTSAPGAISHATDAAYRLWVADFHAAMLGCGMVQTSDTGQLNPLTIVRPVANTTNDYYVYAFNDGLAPIIIKCLFGSGIAATSPGLSIQVGVNTDGAGNIQLPLRTAQLIQRGSAAGASSYTTYAYHEDGIFWIAFKLGSLLNSSQAGLAIIRSTDSAGTPNNEAFTLVCNQQSSGINNWSQYSIRVANAPQAAAVYAVWAADYSTQLPGNVTSTLVGIDPQVMLVNHMTPRFTPMFGCFSYRMNEIAMGVVVPAEIVGVGDKDFLTVGHAIGSANGITLGLALLWA